MKNIFLSISTLIISLFLLAAPSFAFTLDSIGASSTTSGNPGTEWWYTGQNPTLVGTAVAGSTVNITIESTAYTSTADASGNWSYYPTTLVTGDHSVSVTGDGQTINFTLHIGQNVPTGTSSSTASGTLPVSGSTTQTLVLLGTGTAIIFLGLKLKPHTTS